MGNIMFNVKISMEKILKIFDRCRCMKGDFLGLGGKRRKEKYRKGKYRNEYYIFLIYDKYCVLLI
jgi:hypothetical protein